jgi:pilus assembly protein FimV
MTAKRLLAAAGLALFPLATMAAGLGKLTVLSTLGQPLRAEVEVVSIQRGEAESLAAKLASPEAFREAGVDYGPMVPQMRAALERRPNGQTYIVLSTVNPMEEPFLDLLLELNWAAGRLVRQYTFLLDPAEYKGPTPIAAAPRTPVVPEVKPVETPKPPAAQAAAPQAAAPQAAAPQPAAPRARTTPSASTSERPAAPVSPAPASSYAVKQGDTLLKIAQQFKPESVTTQQMLVALQRANEDAFINNNMNLLRAGRVLSIPEKAAAESVNPVDANKAVLAQGQAFNEYRNKLAQAVASAPASVERAQQRAAGTIGEKPADSGTVAKVAPRDELRISRVEDAGKDGKAAAAARGDDVTARERALREANERVTELEKNVTDLRKLLELKNQQLAEAQKAAEAARPAAAPPVPAPAPEPAAKAPEAPKSPEAATDAAKATDPAIVKAPEAPDASTAPPPVAEAPKPEPAPQPVPAEAKKPAPPPPAPSFVDTILDEPMYLAAGGGGILALLIGGYIWRRKRSAKLETSLLGATTSDSSSVFGTTGGRNVDTGGSSLQTDFSQSGIGAIDTDEVDPVAEADVYMAYGRDAQAEEILKEALQKDPARQSVRVKLLEIYASRRDLKAFETTAGEVFAATGGQGPEWQKAVELGLSVDPTNPMYGGKKPEHGVSDATIVLPASTAAAALAPDLPLDVDDKKAPLTIDFDLGAPAANEISATPDISVGIASEAPPDLGFDLDLGAPEKRTEKKQPEEEASDFSPSGTFIMDPAAKKAVTGMMGFRPPESGTGEIDFELPDLQPNESKPAQPARNVDFDLNFGEPTQPSPPPTGAELSGISFDTGGPASVAGVGIDVQWQEVATKLDLAKAYEEMGDKDGARELLNEVVQEGDATQQRQAKELLETLH